MSDSHVYCCPFHRDGGSIIQMCPSRQRPPFPPVEALVMVAQAGKELFRVPAGVTPDELRAWGFYDVAAHLEGRAPWLLREAPSPAAPLPAGRGWSFMSAGLARALGGEPL
jgi:hypothetical protein